MDEARQLGHERERLERGIATVLQLLEGVGESAPLVDPEGFPRSDIDVHGVRHARAELAKLRFDLGKVNGRLVTALHAAHAEARGNGDEVVETISTPGASKKHERVPFASFDEVTAGSPAADAGIVLGDLLLLFGSVDHTNFVGMASIADVVRNSVGKRIKVMLKRGDKIKLLPLFPQKWAGNGLLGCRIVALAD